ncbi:MAG: endonuclease/exonuclease/phosphatase family protein [bacterium]
MFKTFQKTALSVTDMAARTGLAVALIVTIGAFMPFWYYGEQAASLRPYWLLGIVPAAAWFALRKNVGLALIAASLAVAQATPLILAETRGSLDQRPLRVEPSARSQDVRVLVINAYIGNPDQTRFVRLAQDTRADVVMVTELDEPLARALAAEYPHSTSQLNGVFGMGIFSRFPLTDITVDTDPPFDAPRIHAKMGDTSLILVHPLPPGNQAALEGRNALIQALAHTLQETTNPIILGGDFNTTTWSSHMAPLHRVATRARSGGTFPAHLPLRIPIDHVFFRGFSEIGVFEFHEEFGSDHVPFVVVLRKGRDQRVDRLPRA